MTINLSRHIEKPLIIEGFPGFGLIGAISTEFLISHLKCELVGEILMDELPATIAIHNSTVVHPIGIYYNEKYNLLIIHSISSPQGLEWKIGKEIVDLARQVNAWEIICIEGVGSSAPNDKTNAYFFTNNAENKEKLEKAGVEELKEGIIIGVTSSVLIYGKENKLTSIFAEAHSQLPDSKAAAKVIEILDKYLGLEVDYDPLLKVAEQFEDQLKGLIKKSESAQNLKDKKTLSYVG